ncbi:MAG: ABC transporter permease subunit [Clostridiales bacterium]|nr:ABC transporter permease subunit [Clostridiales bacterium]
MLRNTFVISFYSIVLGFPAPIILALLINEVRRTWFKRSVQTITYLPHFISLVVVCGMIRDFTSNTGVISVFAAWLSGSRPITMLNEPGLFVPIYVSSGIWQEVGWGSIVYLSAISNIDPQLYEAAVVDGAGRFRQMLHVTLPALVPIILTLLILRMGSVLSVGYEKTILLVNPITTEAGEVISSYVYRRGLIDRSWSFASAVGLFNSVINLFFLIGTNYVSKKAGEVALW